MFQHVPTIASAGGLASVRCDTSLPRAHAAFCTVVQLRGSGQRFVRFFEFPRKGAASLSRRRAACREP